MNVISQLTYACPRYGSMEQHHTSVSYTVQLVLDLHISPPVSHYLHQPSTQRQTQCLRLFQQPLEVPDRDWERLPTDRFWNDMNLIKHPLKQSRQAARLACTNLVMSSSGIPVQLWFNKAVGCPAAAVNFTSIPQKYLWVLSQFNWPAIHFQETIFVDQQQPRLLTSKVPCAAITLSLRSATRSCPCANW